MNAPRHDPEELRSALDALAEVLAKQRDLEVQREILQKQIWALGSHATTARARAAQALKREGGTVVHNGSVWKVNDHGFITCEAVQVNLDAIKEASKGGATELHLTPPASEKAA